MSELIGQEWTSRDNIIYADGHPILVAVSADGESAEDRAKAIALLMAETISMYNKLGGVEGLATLVATLT